MTTITTTCQVGKSLAIKALKRDEEEVVVAQLAFGEAFVSREEADEVLGVPIGWTMRLYDEQGAPEFRGTIDLTDTVLDCIAMIGQEEEQRLVATNAAIGKMKLELVPNGMLLSGTLEWPIAGDESADAEHLLAGLHRFVLTVTRPLDLFRRERVEQPEVRDGAH